MEMPCLIIDSEDALESPLNGCLNGPCEWFPYVLVSRDKKQQVDRSTTGKSVLTEKDLSFYYF